MKSLILLTFLLLYSGLSLYSTEMTSNYQYDGKLETKGLTSDTLSVVPSVFGMDFFIGDVETKYNVVYRLLDEFPKAQMHLDKSKKIVGVYKFTASLTAFPLGWTTYELIADGETDVYLFGFSGVLFLFSYIMYQVELSSIENALDVYNQSVRKNPMAFEYNEYLKKQLDYSSNISLEIGLNQKGFGLTLSF
jgi:hypothetical protein